MNKASLWSLRLGYSNAQSQDIANLGLSRFLEASFHTTVDKEIPSFLDESPKTLAELKERRKFLKAENKEDAKAYIVKELKTSNEMKAWWLHKIATEKYPLREKMTCFWHNHFVATFQKVKVNHWIFNYNQMLRENAFGNFKTLTKLVLNSNAMVRYLDNTDNRKGAINENLSRELLELFTLGIGNYTENDIKNGAKALAGLGIGEDQAQYRRFFEDDDQIVYFGKQGHFKSDDLVDIIFEQKAIPYLITRKILQWFIYDTPDEHLVTYYGDYFRSVHFEIKPLLTKIFTEEYQKENSGSKIKNPLEFIVQLLNELDIQLPKNRIAVAFLRDQGMDLFNQPNVKGWTGGKAWLTSQIYLQRNNSCDLLCSGKNFYRSGPKKEMEDENMTQNDFVWHPRLDWKHGTNKEIIMQLSDRLLFRIDQQNQKDFESILKYDFDSESQNANEAILRVFNAMTKTPEFQLI